MKPELSPEEKGKLPCGLCGTIQNNHPVFATDKCPCWVPPMFCSQECCPGSCECEDCGGCD